MAKWHGAIGYSIEKETEPGVWLSKITEQEYYGDLTRDFRKRTNSGSSNDNIELANTLSIIADPFVIENCSRMCYVSLFGTKWKISNVEVQYPRLIISLGGVYNG